MSEKKFLTVMAVFDTKTHLLLSSVQNYLIDNISLGTQTMGIPFHLTLGSFPVDDLEQVTEAIKRVTTASKPFDIYLTGYNNFGHKVFFIEPEITDELIILRKSFERDYANGYEWVPHATLFCGNENEVGQAEAIAPRLEFPIKAQIVGIELGEFFPPEKKLRIDF